MAKHGAVWGAIVVMLVAGTAHAGVLTWHGQPVQLLVLNVPFPHSFPDSIKKYVQYQGQLKVWVGADDVPVATSLSVHLKIDHRFFLVLPIHMDMQGSGDETLRHVGQRLLIEHEHHRMSLLHHGVGKTEDLRAKLTLSSQYQGRNDASSGLVSG